MTLLSRLETFADKHSITIDRSRAIPRVDGAYFEFKGGISAIYINPALTGNELNAVMAEEIGHYLTSVGDSVFGSQNHGPVESAAMTAAVDLALSREAVLRDIRGGYSLHEVADRHEVTVPFIRTALDIWRRKGHFLEEPYNGY